MFDVLPELLPVVGHEITTAPRIIKKKMFEYLLSQLIAHVILYAFM